MKDNDINIILSKYENTDFIFKNYYLRRMLKKFSDETIIEQIGMAEMPKIVFVLEKKYNQKANLIPIENDLMIQIGKTNVANMSYLAVYLHFMSVKNNKLHLEGNISLPANVMKYSFHIKLNGKVIEVPLKKHNLDLKLGKEIYEKRDVFVIDVTLSETENKIEFFNDINGYECRYARINSMRFAPISDAINGQYCMWDGWVAQVSENFIKVDRTNCEKNRNYEADFEDGIKQKLGHKAEWVLELRREYWKYKEKKQKPLWIVMDRTDRADDNGEIFFKYMQKHPEIKTYFIIEEQCEDYQRLKGIGEVIPLYSKEHYLAALLADCVISSQCNGWVENPFWEKAEFFRDIYHKPQIIFLQHGVIKDDMSPTLNRYNTNFTGFVTSTKDEYESILKYPYFYSKKEVWCTGLPVFDELKNRRQKKILVMPTWRQGLMHQEWNEKKEIMEWVPNECIKDSEYYRRYYSLLHNKKLIAQCKQSGYKIAFKSHPLLEPYIKDIVDSEMLEWWGYEKSYKDAFAEGNILITDYSSVAFEFAYLRKPIVYYQFDEKNFFEKHTYRKGYFDYHKNGFGEVERYESRLIDRICKYIKEDCQLDNKYKERIEYAYNQFNRNACEEIYTKVCAEGEAL